MMNMKPASTRTQLRDLPDNIKHCVYTSVEASVIVFDTYFFYDRVAMNSLFFWKKKVVPMQSERVVQRQKYVAGSVGKFSAALYRQVGKTVGGEENFSMSPFSVAAVSAMTCTGAKENTARQIRSALYIPDDEVEFSKDFGQLVKAIKGNENYILEVANRIYVAKNYKLLGDFQSTLKDDFGAKAKRVDFAKDSSRVKINKWVEKRTSGEIQELLKPEMVRNDSRIVLVNAIYFKGGWLEPFEKKSTCKQPFYLGSKQKKIQVDMMHREGEMQTGDLPELDARVLELPYKGWDLSTFIILPNKLDGLSELESRLESSNMLDNLANCTRMAKLQISIPKFKIESDLNLEEHLQALGMTDLFKYGKADLSGIDGGRELYISTAIQKGIVEVNEEGSEAAAATFVSVKMGSQHAPIRQVPTFVADHPFIFVIRDNRTGLSLFIGRLSNPK